MPLHHGGDKELWSGHTAEHRTATRFNILWMNSPNFHTERETYKAHASHVRFKNRQNCSVLFEVRGHHRGRSKGTGGRRTPAATWNLLCLDPGTGAQGRISS